MKNTLIFLICVTMISFFRLNNAMNTSKLIPEPTYTSYANVARWAVARANFGTISTTSVHLEGIPWGNTASCSDGIASDTNGDNSTGIPYFYLTTLDATAQDIMANPNVSFSITKASFPDSSYCSDVSAEDPTCVRVTLAGKMMAAKKGSAKEAYGLQALYSKHPMMKEWPVDHDWMVMYLSIDNIFLLDFYGGSHKITLDEYLKVKL